MILFPQLLCVLLFIANLADASFESSPTNNWYYSFNTRLVQPWSFIPAKPIDPEHTIELDWTFLPDRGTMIVQVTTKKVITPVLKDYVVGLDLNTGQMRFNVTLDMVEPGVSLLGNGEGRTWFLGTTGVVPFPKNKLLILLDSETGELKQILPVTIDNHHRFTACFSRRLLYLLDESSISQYYYNSTLDRLVNTWTRTDLPPTNYWGKQCSIIDAVSMRGTLVYFNTYDKLQLVTRSGSPVWPNQGAGPLQHTYNVFRPSIADSRRNLSYYLQTFDFKVPHSYYVDAAGNAKLFTLDPSLQRSSDDNEDLTRLKSNQGRLGAQVAGDRDEAVPFVISEKGIAVVVSFYRDNYTVAVFGVLEGKVLWKVPLDWLRLNDLYRVVIDDDKSEVYVFARTNFGKFPYGRVYSLTDGTVLRDLSKDHYGRKAALFQDAIFLVHDYFDPNGPSNFWDSLFVFPRS